MLETSEVESYHAIALSAFCSKCGVDTCRVLFVALVAEVGFKLQGVIIYHNICRVEELSAGCSPKL